MAIPPELPVFTIKDRKLVGSMLPDPFDDDWGRRKLAGRRTREPVPRRMKTDERSRSATRSVTRYPRSYKTAPNVRYDDIVERHSIVWGDLAYLESRIRIDMPGAAPNVQLTAYDGEWTRFVAGDDTRDPQWIAVTLRLRGGRRGAWGFPSGLFVHRSHTLLLNTSWFFGSLGELLAAKPQVPTNQAYYRFRYCGGKEVDGHSCIEVRGGMPPDRCWNPWKIDWSSALRAISHAHAAVANLAVQHSHATPARATQHATTHAARSAAAAARHRAAKAAHPTHHASSSKSSSNSLTSSLSNFFKSLGL